jgi:hypothetical protein
MKAGYSPDVRVTIVEKNITSEIPDIRIIIPVNSLYIFLEIR